MNDDLDLLAVHERVAKERAWSAARDLRQSLSPSTLTRRAVRRRPWAALAVAAAGGALIGSWFASAPDPSVAMDEAPPRPRRDWLRVVTQISQVVGTFAAARAAHDQGVAADAVHV